ncbi:latrophilin-like protein LAT-2 [Dysidea avara]|uniref:latrophilin-like protein LAT-2 n=1 Tax=Dysidea avara TaxID=196820 RepID=UPI00331FC347
MPYFRRPSHILVNFVIATGLLVNFTSNNFTNLEASHFVTTKIALSYYEIKNILIEIEVVVSEFSPRATGGTLNDETPEAITIRSNVVIKASLISNDSVQAGEDYVFPRENDDLSNFTGGNTQFRFPNDALKGVLKQLPNYTMGFPITSTILRDDIIQLPNPSNENETFLPITPIVSIQAPVPVNTSENNAIMISFPVKDDSQIFESLKLSRNLPTTLQTLASRQLRTKSCQFYDHNLQDLQLNQAGGWSQEGLRLDNSSTDTRITCFTTHLTSFAVLVSVHGTKPTPADDALSIISYIGCAISLVCLCLSVVILTYVLFRTKDKKNNVFVHLNLCIALALGLIVFVSGIETATEYRASCIIVAVLLQYFFISAFCWMLCEGVMLYMMLVTVFGNKLNRRLFFFILGWGPAIPIVAISAGIVHRHYGTDDYCWIKSEDGAIAAFIAPIGAMILINCVFLGITLKVLYQNTQP